MRRLRRTALTLLSVALLALPAAGASARPAAAAKPPSRWVGVSVATLWVKPGLTRPVDRPSAANPAEPRAWAAGMGLAQKRALVGRLETQALYGSKVYLLGTSGGWSRVAVAGQPSPRNRWGYPGWVPTRQLVTLAPVATGGVALVTRRSAWIYSDARFSERVLQLSYGTHLPLLSSADDGVEVALPDGRSAFARRSAVAVRPAGSAWPAVSGEALVAEARRFLGLQYLWAGTSGFGLDCSGLTYLVHHALGVSIPRDAAPQSRAGVRVAAMKALRPGDLVFFRPPGGTIHHVGMYVGDGRMIHAPATGSRVRITFISREPYVSEFAGGRRYAP